MTLRPVAAASGEDSEPRPGVRRRPRSLRLGQPGLVLRPDGRPTTGGGSRSRTLAPRTARQAVVTVRGVLAAATWLAPRTSGRLFGISVEQNPAGPYFGRLYGARSALMAATLLTAGGPEQAAKVARQHAVVDAADVMASVIGARRGQLGARGAGTTGVTALGLLLLGLQGGRHELA